MDPVDLVNYGILAMWLLGGAGILLALLGVSLGLQRFLEVDLGLVFLNVLLAMIGAVAWFAAPNLLERLLWCVMAELVAFAVARAWVHSHRSYAGSTSSYHGYVPRTQH